MKDFQEPKKTSQQVSSQNGGIRAIPFIIVNESFEKVASYGLMATMILYVMNGYHLDTAVAGSVLGLWSAMTNFSSILGAFISDSYLGRFRLIALASVSSFFGMVLLWLTAMVPQAKPTPCDSFSEKCESATPAQLALLWCSFVLMSIGAGGIRPCSMAFGADQLDKKDSPRNERVIQSFFNWYYAFNGISTFLALTIIVYIQDQMGWKVGFGVPAILMFLSALFFVLGSSYYVKVKPNKSLFTRLVQVLVVAFKNRRLALPPKNSDKCYYHSKDDSMLVAPTDKLRCLNKACIIRNPEEDLNSGESASKPWEICSVDQVEELKSLIKVLPIWSTGIVIYLGFGQSSITILEANTMDRHIIYNFQIPSGSFNLFTIFTLTIGIAFYDRIVVPVMAKYTGQTRGISPTKRMGIGLLLSCMSMAVAAMVEHIRRRTAIEQGLSENPQALVNMSAMWLAPQYCLMGLAEAFNAVGQVQFYFSQLPKSMSSFAMALFILGNGFADLLGGLIIRIVDAVTKSGGKESWVSSNLNKGHYDYYYWIFTVLSFVNYLYFLVCCWAYGPYEEERTEVSRDLKEGLLSKSKDFPSNSSA